MAHRDSGPPSTAPDEKSVLLGFLNYLRDAITTKVSDAPEPHVRTAGVPSGTNLLGLAKHLAHVERYYFFGDRITSLRRTMRPTTKDTVESILTDYRQTITRANELVESCPDLTRPLRAGGPSLRWILVHLIEETARHTGHADILREHLDGTTGR
ncbi:DinB family protein [Dactylosporangium sp. NPDC006015]|uniref:DinB family protein n=1 Tax=Dactylosporangium sp. NPDC006015 TaxID=3154576 RepID=UPI0033A214E9